MVIWNLYLVHQIIIFHFDNTNKGICPILEAISEKLDQYDPYIFFVLDSKYKSITASFIPCSSPLPYRPDSRRYSVTSER